MTFETFIEKYDLLVDAPDWNVADVNPDLMDLSDPPPFKAQKPFKPSRAFGVVG